MRTPETPPPYSAVRHGTLEEFLEACDAYPNTNPKTYFIDAFTNDTPANRVAIANWMLDNGVPASYVERDPRSRYNALHILFVQREHDYELEAPLLRRLLAEGADINGYAPRLGRPIQALLENDWIDEDDLGPFYDVIFAHPGIDWNVPANLKGAPKKTLRERVEAKFTSHPEMIRRMHHYLKHGPTPEPNH
ncbi:hypothetical protein [Gulosibacter bifidus]|uniref:Ankyrin repeat domain-containing protein n=1 Tax=Gulosibacter bifidus TaxID=272239 RepID=A0ABW5RJU5_9MICO|nr:hypothetical protein [Gulosibacter bifidus]